MHLAVTSLLCASIWAVFSEDGLVQPEQAMCWLLGETLVLSAADRAYESLGQGGRMGLLILGISTANCLQH